MSKKKRVNKDLLESGYSRKIQSLFGLSAGKLSYDGERHDYSKFDFNEEDIDELTILALDRSDYGLNYDDYKEEIDRFYRASLHAVVVLGQMKASESMEPILYQHYKEEDNDFFNELIPEFIVNMGYENVHILKKHLFLVKADKLFLLDGVGQLIQKEYAHKSELAEIFMDYIRTTEDGRDHLSAGISSLINATGDAHIDFIRRMFRTRDVSLAWRGDIEDIEISLGLRKDRGASQSGNSVQMAFENADKKYKEYKNLKSKTKISEPQIGRNDTCPCGSGKKYKKCCLNK